MRTSLSSELFTEIDLPLPDRRDGKVRCRAIGHDRRLIVTTDRLSVLDCARRRAVQGTGPQPVGRLVVRPDGRSSRTTRRRFPIRTLELARFAVPLPVEVVVRGHITGVTDTSIWGMYADGARTIYGYDFPTACRRTPRCRTTSSPPPPRPRRAATTCRSRAEVVESGTA
ncbi:MAG: hypothetical protein R2697_10965 [Ilumatobacteraceae bacterium]